MYRTFTTIYFMLCWVMYFAEVGFVAAIIKGSFIPQTETGIYWVLMALSWVGSGCIGLLIMAPHMRYIRDKHPELWEYLHFVPGITPTARKYFGDSPMANKYNSFRLVSFAFSREIYGDPSLRAIKNWIKSITIYMPLFFLSLIPMGALMQIVQEVYKGQ